MLVSFDTLARRGYLGKSDLDSRPLFPKNTVDFGAVIRWKLPLLKKAFEGFRNGATAADRDEFAAYCAEHAAWLDEFALFMSLKEQHDLIMWTKWSRELALREPSAIERAKRELRDDIERHKFIQFEFERQWRELKRYCGQLGIRLMGDVPIYVALDSADVWANRELFKLNEEGQPTVVAGVPPDYFSATGQLWGNPIYRWEVHAQQGYSWWVTRFRRALEMLDMIRLDHFRGFAGFFEIPAGEETAVNGRWVQGPGAALFAVLEKELGSLPIVAENLGVITPEVESLREQFGFPGMAILQFAFGKDPQAPDFKPHRYPHHKVAYTGTHDNDTVAGWWNSTGASDSTRTSEDVAKEMEYARRYLNTDGSEIHWVMIRKLMESVADTVLFPLQDVLGLGSEARMNLPGTRSGNWRWRLQPEMLMPDIVHRLRELAATYER